MGDSLSASSAALSQQEQQPVAGGPVRDWAGGVGLRAERRGEHLFAPIRLAPVHKPTTLEL
eukprot:scaffold74439_cov32-Tisochrysis_lutea.AAC.1